MSFLHDCVFLFHTDKPCLFDAILMKHILGLEASSGLVPAYAACSVLLTVLHSPKARRVSVSHPDYNFELCCTEVTMSQKHLLPLLKIANYGSVPFHISSLLQAESTKIRLKCQAGEGRLDPSLGKKVWAERGRRESRESCIIWEDGEKWCVRCQVPECLWVKDPRSCGLTAEAQALKCTPCMSWGYALKLFFWFH